MGISAACHAFIVLTLQDLRYLFRTNVITTYPAYQASLSRDVDEWIGSFDRWERLKVSEHRKLDLTCVVCGRQQELSSSARLKGILRCHSADVFSNELE
jgi:hypothetical protein